MMATTATAVVTVVAAVTLLSSFVLPANAWVHPVLLHHHHHHHPPWCSMERLQLSSQIDDNDALAKSQDPLLQFLPEDTTFVDQVNRTKFLRFATIMNKTIGLDDPKKLETMIKQRASLLVYSGAVLRSKMNFIQTELGLTTQEMQRIISRAPCALSASNSTFLQRVESWTAYLGDRQTVKNLAVDYPPIFDNAFQECYKPKLDYWLDRCFDGNKTELQKVILKTPTYMLSPSLARMKQRVAAFKRLGLDARGVHRYMRLTTKDFEFRFGVKLNETQLVKSNLTKYKRVEQLLVSELGCDVAVVGKIVKRYPVVFHLSEDSLLSKLAFLRHTLGFTNKELEKMIQHCPTVFSLTNETLQKKMDYLQHELFGGDFDSMRKLVSKNPHGLSLQVENMQRSIKFLNDMANGNTSRVQIAVLTQPSFLFVSEPTLEHNADVLLQHWFRENNTAFQDAVLRQPISMTFSKERTERRIDQVVQVGLDYSSHGNLNFLKMTEDQYGRWLGNRQEEAECKRLEGC